MLYFANPTSPATVAAMAAQIIGYIDTPTAQQNHRPRPPGSIWCADNGCFNANFEESHWWGWLQSHSFEADECWFATAPDVLGDAQASLERSTPWLSKIRESGYSPAYVAQDGVTDTVVPWDDFDWLFLGGTDVFKLGVECHTIAAQARARGKRLHMGRVNSLKRWRYAEALGCDSCDGTYLKFGPDINHGRLMSWIDDLHNRPALFTLEDML